ncbi:hypothetical protein EB821_04565 [Candidatus Marinimicrobia bacterium PRS2]|nr:hypothetical protein EB821_04565 [Candidatus Marinimicrobia bacterium PRS2]
MDCAGVCGGSSIEDACGVCGGDNSICTDCFGDVNGAAQIDACGICAGGNSGIDPCPIDCLDIPNGIAIEDNCGTCDSDLTNDCILDCNGVWGGSAVVDECGICGGENNNYFGCTDPEACNYDVSATNDDGSCEYEVDCAGECGGDLEFDCLGECGGDGSTCGGVSLEIQNVDLTAGTLDIFMSNYSGCSYCADSTYNKNSDNWTSKKTGCEDYGDTTWVAYDPITEEECFAIPSIDGLGGWWFNGEVGGFQFELPGVTVTGASGGLAGDYFDWVSTSATTVLGFLGFTGSVIPVGEGVLTQVTFTDFEGSSICFGEDTGSAGNTVISGTTVDDAGIMESLYVGANWGGCFCVIDTDDDGFCDTIDNCPAVVNPNQLDTDGDGAGDLCDTTCPYDANNDVDGDGICDCTLTAIACFEVYAADDNCPETANADQTDTDGDDFGDACDACPMMPIMMQIAMAYVLVL